MRIVDWSRRVVATLATAVVFAAGAACLPDNPYQRFATLDHTIQNRVRWIYERTHFDPAPIDVVVVGSSRTGAAVSAPRLEGDLRAHGHAVTTVNFSLPEAGRDLNWVILQQVLATKRPRLLVIGIIEKPSRFGHPAYKYVAPSRDVVDPAYLGNLNYLSNLVYLPYRQTKLFAAQFFPGFFDLPATFVAARYPGSNDDTTVTFRTGDGKIVERDRRIDRRDLLAGVARYERGVQPALLGPRFADIEFGDDRAYLRRMVDLARQHDVKVAFLFLPYYTGPRSIQERDFYAQFGPIIDAGFLSTHDDWYSDVAHLNHAGALVLTDWLSPQVAALLAADGPVAGARGH